MKAWMKIVLGLVVGMIFGLLINHSTWISSYHSQLIYYLSLMGKIFIDLLKMIVGILIFSSLVSGICHINDPKKLGRMGMRAISFFLFSTLIAISLGLFFSLWIQPGRGLHLTPSSEVKESSVSLFEFLLQIVPSNPIAAFAEGNTLQIIFFAALFAIAIVVAQEKGKPVLTFIESLTDIMQVLTRMVMRLAPYGVFALIASAVASIGFKVLKPLLWIIVCNYAACLTQIFCVFCLTIRLFTKIGVAQFFIAMKEALLVAFTTCSSAAALPASMESIHKRLGVPKQTTGFIMSLGITMNMNGAAIGQTVAAVFIAGAYGIEITAFKILLLFVTAIVASIGAAGIPGSSLIMLSVVLNALGLPLEGVGLVAGVDRLREMLSTVTNILGDAVATVYVAHREKHIEEKQTYAVT